MIAITTGAVITGMSYGNNGSILVAYMAFADYENIVLNEKL